MAPYASDLAGKTPIQFTDAFPPTVTVTAGQIGHDAGVLNDIASSYLLSVTDSASNLNNLDLSHLTANYIGLTPTTLGNVTESAQIVDLNLTQVAGLAGDATITVQSINHGAGTEFTIESNGASYTIDLTNSAAAHLQVDGPVAAGIQNPTVSSSDLLGNIAYYEDLAKAGQLGHITLTDAGAPTLSLTADQFVADSSVLGAIQSQYHLAVTGIAAGDVQAFEANPIVTAVSVSDTAANVQQYFAQLQSANTAGFLNGVVVADGGSITSNTGTANLALLTKISGASQLQINLSSDGYASQMPAALNAVSSVANNFLSPVSFEVSGIWGATMLGGTGDNPAQDLLMMQTLLDAHPSWTVQPFAYGNFSFQKYSGMAELGGITNPALISALGGIGGYSPENIGASTTLTYYESPIFNKFKIDLTGSIQDSAAHVQANLDALAPYASDLAGKLPIQFTDAFPPTVTVNAGQIGHDAGVLNDITSSYLLSVTDSATNLNNLDLSNLTASRIELAPTTLGSMTESTGVTDLNLTQLQGLAVDTTIVEHRINAGAGTEVDITSSGVTTSINLAHTPLNSLEVYSVDGIVVYTPPGELVIITSAGGLTNHFDQIITGTGVAGTHITISDASTVIGSATVAADGTWTASVNLQNTQGNHTITAVETNSAGNVSPSLPLIYTVDSIPPTITQTSELSSNVNHSTLARVGDVITESFTVDPSLAGVGVSVDSVTIDGRAALVNHISGDQYTATYTVQPSDTNGPADVVVTVHDAAGNSAHNSFAGSVDVRTIGPIINQVSEVSNNVNPHFAKANDVITEAFAATGTVDSVTIDGQAATVAQGQGNNYTATYTVQANSQNGPADVVITAHDEVGNTTFDSEHGTVTVDTIAPSIAITSPDRLTNQSHQSIAGTGEVGTTVTILEGANALGTAVVDATGHWVDNVILSGEGAHVLTASDADAAGNVTLSNTETITLDTIAPSITQVSEQSNNANKATLAKVGDVITEAFKVDPSLAGVGVAVGSVTIDGRAATVVHGLGDNYTATYTVHAGDATGLAGVVIVAHDLAGNTASSTLTGTVTVDTVGPTVVPGTETSNNANSTLLAKAGDVITESFKVDPSVVGVGVSVDSVTIDGRAATVVHGTGDNYTATYTVQAGDANGAAGIVINARDAAGNVTTQSATGAVTVDTVAPTVAITSPASGTQPYAATHLAGTGEAGTSIQIFEGQSLLGSTTVASNGTWSDDITLLNRGANSISVTDTDAAGNIGLAVAAYTVAPVHGLEAERALQTTVVTGTPQWVWQDLLSGAVDEDATSPSLAVTDLTFSVNGGAASANVPAGVQLVGNQLWVNPTSSAFSGVTAGHPETVVAHYTISDGHGGNLAETDTITIESPAGNPAVVYDHAPTVAAALHTTVVRGGQPLFEQLLAGAADLDGNALNVQNVTYSINGAAASATVPAGIQIAGNQILVNPNDAAFAGIASGHSETIVVAYTIADGFGGTVAQTDTVTVLGPPAAPANHAPTVQGALNTTAMVGLQAVWGRLLDGASDADAGNVLHVQDATFSINGGAASAIVPGGIQIANDQILVDPNNAAFAGIASGQHETIVVHYNISDGHGGLTAQTDTVTIDGPAPNPAVVANHAPTVAEALAASVTRGGWAQWVQLLAGASDLDNNYLHATNLTYSVNGGAASATIPTGLQFVNDQLYVDPNNAAFAGLGSGQSATIVVHYNVTDGVGGSVAQSDTITILGQASDHAAHNHAPTVAEALTTTVVAGQQGILNSLLAGASDVDGDYLSVANLTYSVNGGAATATTPSGFSVGSGLVSISGYDPSFASLGAGQSETIVMHYNITDGRGGSVAQSETITVVGPAGPAVVSNHAPTVAGALTDVLSVGQVGAMENLLAGALDADGNALHATNVTYSVNGGAASATVPGGVTVYPDQLLVDPNNAAFAGLATGQHETILVSYNVNDGHGGLTAQTDTITVQGPLAAAAAADVTPPVLTGAVSMTTMVGGAPVLPASLLEGAYDADGDVLHTANVTYSVNGGAASAVAPAGVTVASDQVQVNTANAAFAGLATGQHETITLGYDVLDTHGNSVHQSATVTVNGPAASPVLSHDHPPTVAAPLTAETMVGTQNVNWLNLLEGASDADANIIHAANVTFSVNGGAYTANAPSGVTVNGDVMTVNQNDSSFASLGAGQSETIVARYNIVDGIGGSTVQTDTITIEGPTNRHYLDLVGQTLTSTGHSDVFVASLLDGTPTWAAGNVDTILNFNAGAGDRIDLSGLLSATTSVHSTVSINAFNSDSSMISVSVAGTEYYIAKVAGVDLSVPQAVGDLSTLKGASWTDTIDVTSAHGGPTAVTAGAHATLTGAVANAGGDWTIQVVSGTASEDAAHHQLVFSTPSSGNEVIIHTADGVNHDLTNVTSVLWHA